ncbi:MAG: CoA transferase [Acidimicrobiales bacterium]
MTESLRSMRVVDLTDLTGAHGTRILAHMGAEVIRIEPPGGVPERSMPPFLDDRPGPDRSLLFAYMNACKKSVVLDADSRKGRDQLMDLARSAEVVIFSGSAERFESLTLRELATLDNGPVVTALTPFGLTGPMRDWRSNDLVAWASSGLLITIGDPDRAPLIPVPGSLMGCLVGGQQAIMASLAAVRARRRSGISQLVDLSLQEAVASMGGEVAPSVFLDDLIRRVRSGNRRRTGSPFGLFETTDGYAAVLALMPAHWVAMRQWIFEETGNDAVFDPVLEGGAQSRSGDVWDVVNIFTEDLTVRHTSQEMFQMGQQRGIPVTPVNDAKAVVADPQLTEREFWVDLEVDGKVVKAPGLPFRNAGWTPDPERKPLRAPFLGEHTDAVMSELSIR